MTAVDTLTDDEIVSMVNTYGSHYINEMISISAQDAKNNPYCRCSCCRIAKYIKSRNKL